MKYTNMCTNKVLEHDKIKGGGVPEYEILKSMGLTDEEIAAAREMCEMMCGEAEQDAD